MAAQEGQEEGNEGKGTGRHSRRMVDNHHGGRELTHSQAITHHHHGGRDDTTRSRYSCRQRRYREVVLG